MSPYSSQVVVSETGRRLVATVDLPVGAVVGRFEGDVVPPVLVPDDAVRYALVLDRERWLVPTSDARFADHACDPNCELDDDFQVVTIQPVRAGEPLTFLYNVVRPGEDPGAWDPRWSFRCACGAARCQGDVDGYVLPWSGHWTRK